MSLGIYFIHNNQWYFIILRQNRQWNLFCIFFMLLLSLSHEVRNPLNIISGTMDLALMDISKSNCIRAFEDYKKSL